MQDLEDPRLVKPKSQTYLRSDLLEMGKKEHRGSLSMSRMSSFRSQNSNVDSVRKVSIGTGNLNQQTLPRIPGQSSYRNAKSLFGKSQQPDGNSTLGNFMQADPSYKRYSNELGLSLGTPRRSSIDPSGTQDPVFPQIQKKFA